MIYYRNEKSDVLVNLSSCAEVYLNGCKVMADIGNGRKFPLAFTETPEEAKEIFEKIVSAVQASIGDTLIRIGDETR